MPSEFKRVRVFEKLPPKEQEAILFFAKQLERNFRAYYIDEPKKHGIGEKGAIDLAMALIELIGKCAL
jgi:hypothetical protein